MAVRTARISSIDYAQGTAQVTFPDADDAVSADYPMLAGTYRALSVGDTVQVLEDATGPERGVILGKAYSQKNREAPGFFALIWATEFTCASKAERSQLTRQGKI